MRQSNKRRLQKVEAMQNRPDDPAMIAFAARLERARVRAYDQRGLARHEPIQWPPGTSLVEILQSGRTRVNDF